MLSELTCVLRLFVAFSSAKFHPLLPARSHVSLNIAQIQISVMVNQTLRSHGENRLSRDPSLGIVSVVIRFLNVRFSAARHALIHPHGAIVLVVARRTCRAVLLIRRLSLVGDHSLVHLPLSNGIPIRSVNEPR